MKKLNNAMKLAIFGVVGGSMSLATAQEVVDSTELEAVEVVGSVSKTGKVEYFSPRSVSVIDAETLADRDVQQLDEALRYESGVYTQLYGSDLDTNWYKIRGFDATLRMDGTSIYKGGYFDWQPDMYGTEAIEIVKGADSLTYGNAQTGGLVNIISKRPKDEQGGEIKLTAGNNAERGIAGDYNGVINDDMRFRLVGDYNKRDGELERTWLEHYYFAPSFSWDIGDNTNLTLLASIQKDTGNPTTAFFPSYNILQAGDIPSSRNFGLLDNNFLHNKQAAIGYELTHDFGEGLTLSNNYRYAHSDKEQFSSYYSFMVWGSTDTAQKGTLYANAETDSHTFDVHLSKEWKGDNISNTLTAGADYQHHDIDGVYGFAGWSDPSTINVYDPVYVQDGIPDVPDYTSTQRQLGFYLQNQFSLNDKLLLSAGIRHDKARGNTDSFGSKTSYDLDHTSYSAGAMYVFDNGLAPYASYSESFRPLAGSDGENQYKPYEGEQVEVGVKYSPDFIDGDFSLAYFDLKEKNALVNSATGGVSTQTGKQTSKGVELQANVNITDSLSANLAYTYTNAKNHGASVTEVPAQPKHIYSALLNYEVNDSFSVGAGVRHIGSSTDELGNADAKIPAVTLVDLSAKYQFSKNLEAQLNVSNLTDKEYVSGCYYACYYGEGRRATATMTYKW